MTYAAGSYHSVGGEILLLTLCCLINSRWIDLAEAPNDSSVLDNQSLDSEAEGPEEPDNPESGRSRWLGHILH